MYETLHENKIIHFCFDRYSSDVSAALKAPGRYPDCSGTRNLHDNLADLRAQVAANQKVKCEFYVICAKSNCRSHSLFLCVLVLFFGICFVVTVLHAVKVVLKSNKFC